MPSHQRLNQTGGHMSNHKTSPTFCRRGHLYTVKTLYIAPTGRRDCRTCRRMAQHKWAAKNPNAYYYNYSNESSVRDKKYFGGNRELAIQRDHERCVDCGMTREQHRKTFSRDITVDHIDGRGRYTVAKLRNNKLENLQTLCLPCHGRKDVIRKWKTLKKESK